MRIHDSVSSGFQPGLLSNLHPFPLPIHIVPSRSETTGLVFGLTNFGKTNTNRLHTDEDICVWNESNIIDFLIAAKPLEDYSKGCTKDTMRMMIHVHKKGTGNVKWFIFDAIFLILDHIRPARSKLKAILLNITSFWFSVINFNSDVVTAFIKHVLMIIAYLFKEWITTLVNRRKLLFNRIIRTRRVTLCI